MNMWIKYFLTIFCAERKFKQNIRKNIIPLNNNSENDSHLTNGNKFMKLSKLNIQKLDRDFAQFTHFWNTFKVFFHDNDSLQNRKVQLYSNLLEFFNFKCHRTLGNFGRN